LTKAPESLLLLTTTATRRNPPRYAPARERIWQALKRRSSCDARTPMFMIVFALVWLTSCRSAASGDSLAFESARALAPLVGCSGG